MPARLVPRALHGTQINGPPSSGLSRAELRRRQRVADRTFGRGPAPSDAARGVAGEARFERTAIRKGFQPEDVTACVAELSDRLVAAEKSLSEARVSEVGTRPQVDVARGGVKKLKEARKQIGTRQKLDASVVRLERLYAKRDAADAAGDGEKVKALSRTIRRHEKGERRPSGPSRGRDKGGGVGARGQPVRPAPHRRFGGVGDQDVGGECGAERDDARLCGRVHPLVGGERTLKHPKTVRPCGQELEAAAVVVVDRVNPRRSAHHHEPARLVLLHPRDVDGDSRNARAREPIEP